MVQVKGFMPPRGGINRETPAGRAGGQFCEWHNFFLRFRESDVIFLGVGDFTGFLQPVSYACKDQGKELIDKEEEEI